MKIAPLQNFEVERLVPQEAVITEFPGFVLIERSNQSPGECGWAMRTEDFAHLLCKHKGHDFIFDQFNVSYKLIYQGTMDERLGDYIHRPQYKSDYLGAVDIRRIMELGHFQNIVYDGTVDDGYLYDLNGDPVYRSFRIELGSMRYKVNNIFNELDGHEKISSLELSEVPYYNADIIGSTEIRFNYYPDEDEFFELVKIDKKNFSSGVTNAIVERLELQGDILENN